MRFQKGGVWKNHEDEVLKAAVMKYGKNQWSRIASLLPKKTGKMAKERWNSWLDPSIKKTEWTKEEEEKLLYISKIMPAKWQSIAQIVGRTPHQCLTHYNHLLDKAMEQEGDIDPTDDPTKMRPGTGPELNPEQKAPMPDGDDMSEDEKEMLNEARARLANTQGKKAKRKARGKQIEEARRLASVQKRRELRAAGIDVATHSKKRKGMDYATEIPFFKAPPPGAFDTSEELKLRKQDDSSFQNLDIQKAEGQMRIEKEGQDRRDDKKKQLKKKQDDLAGHYEKLNQKNDPSASIKKAALTMPAPQVTEADLRSLQKMGGAIEQSEVTRTRTVQQEDMVAIEAQNQARMRAMETPLLDGGETPQVRRTGLKVAATPSANVQATPNVYAARAKDVRREEKAKQRLASGNTVVALNNLPAPKGRHSLAVQMSDSDKKLLTEEEKVVEKVAHIDATDATAVKKKKKGGQLLATATGAVQRALPRPASLPARLHETPTDAQSAIDEEMRKLVAYDATVHPMTGKPGRNKHQLVDYSQDELAKAAAQIIEEEMKIKESSPFFKKDKSATSVNGYSLVDARNAAQELCLAEEDAVFVPNPARVVSKRQCSTGDLLNSLKHEFDVVRNHTARQVEVAAKLEKKADMYTAGYLKVNGNLTASLQEKWNDLQDARVQLASYEEMWRLEEVAIKERTRVAKEKVSVQKEKEASLQASYAKLKSELGRIAERQTAKRAREEAVQAEMDALAELEAEVEVWNASFEGDACPSLLFYYSCSKQTRERAAFADTSQHILRICFFKKKAAQTRESEGEWI